MPNLELFNNSQGVQAERIKFVTNISSPAGVGALKGGRLFIALTMQQLAHRSVHRT
jgi:hypothetical protein